jgi:histidine triad (HIT) family protein
VRHAAYLADLDAPTAGLLMQHAQRIAGALRKSGVRCEGVNLFLADGEAATQEVFHVHLHVFPRFSGDGFGLRFGPAYKELPPREALEEIGAKIISVLRP